MIAIIFAFVSVSGFFGFVNGGLNGVHLAVNIIASVMMAVSVVATVFSGWDYIYKGKNLFKDV